MVSFQEVINSLADSKIIMECTLVTQKEHTYQGVRFLSDADLTPCKNYIYIGYTAELLGLDPQYRAGGLLLIKNCQYTETVPWGNLIVLQEGIDLIHLFHTVQSLFDLRFIFERNSSSMLALLTEGKELQDIVAAAAQMLGNPVLLPDSSGRLIAAATDMEISDPASGDFVTSGYITGTFIKELQVSKMDLRIIESQEPVLLNYGPFKKMPRIVNKIKVHKRTVAYIIVLEVKKKLLERDYDLIRMICDVIALNMSMKQSFSAYTGEYHENIMIDLLTDHVASDYLNNNLDTRKWELSGDYYVIAVCAPPSCVDIFLYMEYLRMRIKNIFVECKSVYYDKHLVILLNANNESRLIYVKSALEELFSEEQLAAGISRKLNKISEFKKYYSQAVKAVELGQLLEEKRIFYGYEDYYIYDLLVLAGTKTDIKCLCHQCLDTLLTYDRANGTDYYNTLHEFLKHAMSKSKTANKLYIHRNTMDHRIQKITQLIGVDLTDGDECLKLFLSYKIDHLMSKC